MKTRNIIIAGAVLAGAGVPAVTLTSVSASASETTAQHHVIRHLPGWVHWRYASKAESADCSTRNHRAIVLWTRGGTTTSVLCPDGSSFSS